MNIVSALDTKAGGADDNDAQAGHLIANGLTRRYGKGTDSDATDTLIGFHATQDPISEQDGTPALGANAYLGVAHTLRAEGFDASEDGTGRGTPLVAAPLVARSSRGKAQTLSAGHNTDGHMVATFQQSSMAGKGTIGYDADATVAKPSKTQQDGQMLHVGSSVRRLSPVECCRLQGFPDDWLGEPHEQPDGPRYAALGNAVTVNVAHWLGERLARFA